MKISIDWIKEFVNIPNISDKELSERFTLATCEVEGLEKTGEFLSKVFIAQVTKKEPHPDSDHLNIVTFDLGDQGEGKVVCGAPNVEIGIKVPFAPVGTTLPTGLTLTPRKIRGIVSQGMLCGEDEIGLGDDGSGLMVFPENAPVGSTVGEFLNIKENIILDIDNKSITHRPDLWGHYGMAREFAAVFKNPLKNTFDKNWEKEIRNNFTKDKNPVSITVEDKTCCLGYSGISVDNITVEESPLWLKQRLLECDLRPINNIVDISNYVMLELGIPNHIFDRDKIDAGDIIIRPARENQTFVTLDEVEREILAKDTVVADTSKPLVIAGIMGGLESGVTNKTTKIFIETANWKDVEVRKTSTRLGLRTDSSQRYEKCLDTELVNRTVLRLLELVLKICPKAQVVGGLESKNHIKKKEVIIDINLGEINSVLGENLSLDRVISILESLDFSVKTTGDNLTVTVPSYRGTKDIEYGCDIIEEIGRIIGYDNIIPVSPLNTTRAVKLSHDKVLHRKVQDFLVIQGGALEIMTSPLIGKKLLEKADWDVMNSGLSLANAISSDRDRMRPSLIPSILESIALNQKQFSRFSLFEYGRSYLGAKKNFSEEKTQVVLGYFDRQESRYLEARNIFENMMNFTNIPFLIDNPNPKFPNPLFPENWSGIHPVEQLDIKVMGRIAGAILTIHPMVLRKFKIKGNLVLGVLDLTNVMAKPLKDKIKYTPLGRFPSSTFDCTLVASNKTPVINVINAAKKLKLRELQSIKIVDVFYPSNSDTKGVTIRAVFQDREKTLSGEFIKECEDKLLLTLDKAGFPLKV